MTVYINGALDANRAWETLVHELGHLFCWSMGGISGDGGEAGANFAACFLSAMPEIAEEFDLLIAKRRH